MQDLDGKESHSSNASMSEVAESSKWIDPCWLDSTSDDREFEVESLVVQL